MSSLPFKLTICGAADLEALSKLPISHLISIWHPGADKSRYEPGVLSLFPETKVHFTVFDDVESSECPSEGLPSAKEVASALEFSADFGERDIIAVHCMAGISRSTAISTAIFTQHLGPGSEAVAIDKVRAIRPQAAPNRLVVELADRYLGRNGVLSAAVENSFGFTPFDSQKGWANLPGNLFFNDEGLEGAQ